MGFNVEATKRRDLTPDSAASFISAVRFGSFQLVVLVFTMFTVLVQSSRSLPRPLFLNSGRPDTRPPINVNLALYKPRVINTSIFKLQTLHHAPSIVSLFYYVGGRMKLTACASFYSWYSEQYQSVSVKKCCICLTSRL